MTDQLSRPLHSATVGPEQPEAGQPAAAPHRVVFLHGLFGRGKNFTRIASGLLPDAQSLLVDLPNHGRSGWTAHVDYVEMADLVAAHLREGFASGGPVDVVGHSMGGKVAMVLALRHPDLVRRLVVIDISPAASASSRSDFEHLLSALAGLDLRTLERRVDAHERLRESIPNDTVRGFLLQNLRRAEAGDPSERGGTELVWEPNLRLLHDEITTVMGFPDLRGSVFDGPVLWIRGERSDYVSDEDGPAMRELFPRTRRMTVRGAGHWVHSEKPDEVIAALRAFLLAESSR
ncbi:alpha/beta fold hydrolase [Leucobacter sp.]